MTQLNSPIELEFKGMEEIEQQLRQFEQEQRLKLGLEKKQPWRDPNPQHFNREDRNNTTILIGGLTMMQDRLLEAGLHTLGYKIKALDCPDNTSFQVGKEYGNRGQCNPTYFTVGNLVKYLVHLRDDVGMDKQEIIDKFVFVTAGACGPCRFGTYVTEYRKALRDSGFDGFRIFLFKTDGGFNQSDADAGLSFTPKFFYRMFQCIMLGDIINIIGYRIRPYEKNAGDTDQALERCRDILCADMRHGKAIVPALKKCRRVLAAVDVDRLQVKPKVAIIGEFWAMTTEGDGNYRLQRFLEAEGAECEIQPVTNWLLYVLWLNRYDVHLRMRMRHYRKSDAEHAVKHPFRAMLAAYVTEKLVLFLFNRYAKAIGLGNYKLSDQQKIADLSKKYYQSELRGGEGHMEVGKLVNYVKSNKVHMVLSIKPFGCMPSSGVSDGVQSLIVAKYPQANFIPIETSGDSAVNAYSRIQMALFKAKQKAEREYLEQLQHRAVNKSLLSRINRALYYPRQKVAGTAANIIREKLGFRPAQSTRNTG